MQSTYTSAFAEGRAGNSRLGGVTHVSQKPQAVDGFSSVERITVSNDMVTRKEDVK